MKKLKISQMSANLCLLALNVRNVSQTETVKIKRDKISQLKFQICCQYLWNAFLRTLQMVHAKMYVCSRTICSFWSSIYSLWTSFNCNLYVLHKVWMWLSTVIHKLSQLCICYPNPCENNTSKLCATFTVWLNIGSAAWCIWHSC